MKNNFGALLAVLVGVGVVAWGFTAQAQMIDLNLGTLGANTSTNVFGDTTGLSNDFGNYTGVTNPAADWVEDYIIQFDIAQELEFSITANDLFGDPDFFLLSGLNSEILLDGRTSALDGLDASFLDSGIFPETGPVTLLQPGTYYVVADAFGGFTVPGVGATGFFDININLNEFVAPMPPPTSGTLNVMGAMPADTYFQADYGLSVPGEIVWLEVVYDGTAGFSLDTLGTSTTDAGFGPNDTEIGLYDSIGALVASNDDGFAGARESLLEFQAGDLAAGTYYLAVSNFNTTFNTGFDVTTTHIDSGSLQVNADFLAPPEPFIVVGDVVLDEGSYDRGQTGTDADHPYGTLQFTVDTTGTYDINALWDDGVGGSFDGYLYLFDVPFMEDDSLNIAFDDDFEGLDQSRIEGVNLTAGVTYTLVGTTFAGVPEGFTGQFGTVSYRGDGTLTLVGVMPGLMADFDGDGDVDNADLANWQANYGLTAGAINSQGDADGDGDVDGDDFLIWQNEFGMTSAPLQSGNVPEPSSLALLGLAVAGLAWPLVVAASSVADKSENPAEGCQAAALRFFVLPQGEQGLRSPWAPSLPVAQSPLARHNLAMPDFSRESLCHDPIHGYIPFVSIVPPGETSERAILDHPWLQRLRQIHQLQTAWWVFPSAEHTRFQHVVGAMHMGSRVIELLYESLAEVCPDVPSKPYVESLTRMAALLHDVGHGPFGHFFDEHFLKAFDLTHETLGAHIIVHELGGLLQNVRRSPGGEIHSDERLDPYQVAFLIQRPRSGQSTDEHPRWLMMLRSLFCGLYTVDNMDFVLRDAYMSGYSPQAYDLDRLLRYSFFNRDGLAIERRGLNALLRFMLVRSELFRAVYFHRTVRAIDKTLADLFAASGEHLFPGNPLQHLDEYRRFTEWSLLVRVSDWSSSDNVALRTLGDSWNRLLTRQVDWEAVVERNLVFNRGVSEESSIFSDESVVKMKLLQHLPEKWRELPLRIDLPRHNIYRPHATSAAAGQNFLAWAETGVSRPLTDDQLFRQLPVSHRTLRVYLRRGEAQDARQAVGRAVDQLFGTQAEDDVTNM